MGIDAEMSGPGSHGRGADLPRRCDHCGYDLGGTRDAGIDHCPECGWTVAIARSRLAATRSRLLRLDRVLTIAGVVVLLGVIAFLLRWGSPR